MGASQQRRISFETEEELKEINNLAVTTNNVLSPEISETQSNHN